MSHSDLEADTEAELSALPDTSIEARNMADRAGIDTGIAGGIPDIDAVYRGITHNTGINQRDALILDILRANPEVSKNAIYAVVGGNRNEVLARIDELKAMQQTRARTA